MYSPLVMVNNKGMRKVVLNVPVDKDKEIQTTYLINCVWELFNDIKNIMLNSIYNIFIQDK